MSQSLNGFRRDLNSIRLRLFVCFSSPFHFPLSLFNKTFPVWLMRRVLYKSFLYCFFFFFSPKNFKNQVMVFLWSKN